jgi:AbrB family looped-hinge helix DNA binding protein
MTTATITSKSQITIPTAVRAELHVGPGDRIEFVRVADGRYEVVAATQDVTRLRGVIKTSKIVTVEEMNAAIKARAGRE